MSLLDRPVAMEPPAEVPEPEPEPWTDERWAVELRADPEYYREGVEILLGRRPNRSRVPIGYGGFWQEVAEVVARVPALQELLGVGDLAPPVADEEPEEASRAPRAREPAERDEWSGYVRVTAKERGLMAALQLPFWVQAVRRAPVVFWRPRYEKRDAWQLLVQGPYTGLRVLLLPVGNRQRDGQLEWLRARAPLADPPLCLWWQALPSGRKLLAIKRTTGDPRLEYERFQKEVR